MSFKIVITETRQLRRTLAKRWAVVGKDGEGNDKFGYTPEVESIQDVDRKLLEQEVDSLDLARVIRAVNNL